MCVAIFSIWPSFLTLEPLLDAVTETGFPLVDAVMGMQVHMAPRAILININTVPSVPIIVDSSILAGCGYSVPWVKALLHPGSKSVSKDHPNFCTDVDDCSNVAVGSESEVLTFFASIVFVSSVFDTFLITSPVLAVR